MTEIALAQPDTERWDPQFTAKIADRVYPVVRRYFRSEVRGMESMPSQLFLTRGTGLAKRLGLDQRLRLKVLPVSVGFPFGVSAILPPNVPLPSKIVTAVLAPIDIAARFGTCPDVSEVDRHVRSVMQAALDALAEQRRFPILG